MSWLVSDVHVRSVLCREPTLDPKLHTKAAHQALQYNSSHKLKCTIPTMGTGNDITTRAGK